MLRAAVSIITHSLEVGGRKEQDEAHRKTLLPDHQPLVQRWKPKWGMEDYWGYHGLESVLNLKVLAEWRHRTSEIIYFDRLELR